MEKVNKTNPSVFLRSIKFLTGFKFALISMLLLLFLTFFVTIEQTGPGGLYWAMRKYFSIKSFLIFPEINGHTLYFLPLISGYWVCAAFTLNLLVGGILKIRKGVKQIPIIMVHCSMAFLMISGAVTYHTGRETYMLLEKGETSDYTHSLDELSVEVSAWNNGIKQKPWVIESKLLNPLRGNPEKKRLFTFPHLPFDIELSNYVINANLYPDPTGTKGADGFYVLPSKPTGSEEKNFSACTATIIEKRTGARKKIILFEALQHDITVTVDKNVYGLRLHGELWLPNFKVRLDDARGEMHPGSGRAKVYESDVTVISEGSEFKKLIEMNAPLRYRGLTFYQTHWNNKGGKTISGFTVKRNPSDKWPEYAIYVCGLALFVHFLLKLFNFVSQNLKRHEK